MPNALFTLEQGRVPVPFTSAEVALHAFMNNKHAAQRVGTRKSKHEEEVAQHEREQASLIWAW